MKFTIGLMDRISSLLLVLGCTATLLMMLHVCADILGRLIFSRPIGGTLEVVTYIYMVAVAFLPMAVVQRQRQQIIVEVFNQLLPKRVLAFLDGTVAIVGCVFMSVLAWYAGWDALEKTLIFETAPSELNPVPIWPARWMVVAGAALAAAYLAVQAVSDLRSAFSDTEPETGLEPEFETFTPGLKGDAI
ncbi:TRAP transporter small permease subunit [Noviherbaspirillum saxi]|uniref:TRAP transporter small permease protein n=1 Tax=Noviherbaspirillum saxi TaxID=2320863 RepID=A0A3A3FTR0_9BURK|nr:TRAP transporter small permease [Noviherbaspirillum saxi]RJF98644.1 TRAP transporter small permease [Noviherbaspirillum saxi]